MKKIFAFVICAVLLLCVSPVVAFAEGEAVVQESTITDEIVGYIKEHLEEISVIVALIVSALFNTVKNGYLNKSIGTVNNNAVAVAKNSQNAIQNSLTKMDEVASAVVGYEDKIEKMLEAFKVSAEEKQKLQETLDEVHNHLKTAKLANMELANEVAELLVLANIPNSKKEELYSRHLAAVGAITEAEHTEVIINENGQETE